MSRRSFTAADGASWDVWDVHPDEVVGRFAYDRRTGARTEARGEHTARPLDPQLAGGWLCFQSGSDRRRFAPIPAQWDEVPDAVLRVMLSVAAAVTSDARAAPRPSSPG